MVERTLQLIRVEPDNAIRGAAGRLAGIAEIGDEAILWNGRDDQSPIPGNEASAATRAAGIARGHAIGGREGRCATTPRITIDGSVTGPTKEPRVVYRRRLRPGHVRTPRHARAEDKYCACSRTRRFPRPPHRFHKGANGTTPHEIRPAQIPQTSRFRR